MTLGEKYGFEYKILLAKANGNDLTQSEIYDLIINSPHENIKGNDYFAKEYLDRATKLPYFEALAIINECGNQFSANDYINMGNDFRMTAPQIIKRLKEVNELNNDKKMSEKLAAMNYYLNAGKPKHLGLKS
ncbi:MAG: hypothetical protein J5892_02140 [Bacilli bacterium]|nr:hypothetical protein [Bacilli bacterium]